MKQYDFEKLVDKFPYMSEYLIRIEYAKILNMLVRIVGSSMEEETRLCYLEPLESAKMFLEGYLARFHLDKHNYYERLDGQMCFDDEHGVDVLHTRKSKAINCERIKEEFSNMSLSYIRFTYARVLNRIGILKDVYSCESEQLTEIKLFLEGYLAKCVLAKYGFYLRKDGEFCFENRNGVDILHPAIIPLPITPVGCTNHPCPKGEGVPCTSEA